VSSSLTACTPRTLEVFVVLRHHNEIAFGSTADGTRFGSADWKTNWRRVGAFRVRTISSPGARPSPMISEAGRGLLRWVLVEWFVRSSGCDTASFNNPGAPERSEKVKRGARPRHGSIEQSAPS